jgi:polar amino acid transport system permease protein
MFDSNVIEPLLDGALVTVEVTFLGGLLGTAMALLAGLAGFSSSAAIRGVSRTYVEFFRGTSAIVQLFWVFFGVPLVAPVLPEFIPERIVRLTPLEAGVVVLGLNMGAYGSEVVRGAIQAVGQGQREAAIALSLSPLQRMRYVIFPQAVLAMLPPYGNLLIELLKGTALVSLITLSDMTFEAEKLRVNGTADSLTIYTTLLAMYFIIALMITAVIRLLERYFARGLDIGRGA